MANTLIEIDRTIRLLLVLIDDMPLNKTGGLGPAINYTEDAATLFKCTRVLKNMMVSSMWYGIRSDGLPEVPSSTPKEELYNGLTLAQLCASVTLVKHVH